MSLFLVVLPKYKHFTHVSSLLSKVEHRVVNKKLAQICAKHSIFNKQTINSVANKNKPKIMLNTSNKDPNILRDRVMYENSDKEVFKITNSTPSSGESFYGSAGTFRLFNSSRRKFCSCGILLLDLDILLHNF